MKQRSEGALGLLGVAGLAVGVQVEVDGEWWLYMKTTQALVGCAACGTGRSGGRRSVRVRDLRFR